ncbi:hypothetical protein J3458_019927 [Metarhizium acridum]|uniref:uncharacterized protein n=1 Tax=Metarhizium acridum TaxID=92637 RepID=UPI001C6ADD1A|nr:hypothetical protein J3458_019927 [Metarhizium acridum]
MLLPGAKSTKAPSLLSVDPILSYVQHPASTTFEGTITNILLPLARSAPCAAVCRQPSNAKHNTTCSPASPQLQHRFNIPCSLHHDLRLRPHSISPQLSSPPPATPNTQCVPSITMCTLSACSLAVPVTDSSRWSYGPVILSS